MIKKLLFILVSIFSVVSLNAQDEIHVQLKYFEAKFLLDHDRFIEAVLAFEEIEEEYRCYFPNSDISYKIAGCYNGLKESANAILHYNNYIKSTDLSAENFYKIAESYQNIGYAYYNDGEYDIALTYAYKALEFIQNDPLNTENEKKKIISGNCHLMAASILLASDSDEAETCSHLYQSSINGNQIGTQHYHNICGK